MPIEREEIHGAKWWKVDFHNHTPASFDYGKGLNQVNLKKITPRQWLLDYMLKEIDCVVVSDHNSGEWIDKLKDELLLMDSERCDGFRALTIFPGVEISVNPGYHLLAIFDSTKTTADIASLMGAVDYRGERGNSDGVTSKTGEQVIEQIHSLGGIAIPAHVDLDGSGLFKKVSGISLKQTLSVDGLLAIELIEPDYIKPDIYGLLKLRLAEVIGSDSHHPLSDSKSNIGKYFTWVKMEKPKLEALRLALHDGSDGVIRFDAISIDPNFLGNRYFIQQIEVKQAAIAGRGIDPMKLEFSPWLTTVIGGRGTGKSSVVNFLRLAFDHVSDMPNSIKTEFEKFSKVVTARGQSGMLKPDTEILVHLIQNGRRIKIRWSKEFDNHSESVLNDVGQWVETGTISNVSELYPLNIFNQKELFELTKDSKALIDLIDRQFGKTAMQEEISDLSEEWLTQRAELRRLRSKVEEAPNIKAEIAQIQARLAIIENAENKETLALFSEGKSVKSQLVKHSEALGLYASTLEDLQTSLEGSYIRTETSSKLDADSLLTIEALNNEFSAIMVDLENLRTRMRLHQKQFDEEVLNLPFNSIFEGNQRRAHEILDQLKDPSGKTSNNYEELVTRKGTLDLKLKDIDKHLEAIKLVSEQSQAIYQKIIEKEKEIRSNRKSVIDEANARIALLSSEAAPGAPRLKISLVELGDSEEGESRFRNLIRKSGGTFAKDVLILDENGQPSSGLIYEISSESNSENRWSKRLEVITKLLKATEEEPNGFDRRLVSHIDQLRSDTPEDIDRLLVWVPSDRLELKLIDDRGEKNIDTGSAGQRTAGMLTLLMSLGDEPLIIDQPEDDLDSRLITDLIVEGFRKLKGIRQLIIITHNPNVSVNGCAENIVEMKFAAGQIIANVYGALQNKDSRHAVCEVMEGGKTALDNRYFRISKAIGDS